MAFEPPRPEGQEEAGEPRARSPMRAAEVSESSGGSSLAPIATSLDEEDELFFAEGDLASLRQGADTTQNVAASRATSDGDAAPDAHASILSRAKERRRELGRYVVASLAVCTAVCVAAAMRAGLAPSDDPEAHVTPAMAAAATSDAPAIAVSAPEVAPLPPATRPKRAATAATTPPNVSPASATRAKTAHDEKESARRLLAQGKAKDAVTSAERSVALDPSDADAWLVLGAAHQELRHGSSARASFRACLKEAKRGPVAECRAMLR